MGVVSTAKTGLRDLILAIAPPWLRRGSQPGPLNGGMGDGRLLYTFGALGDLCLEKLDQGMRAHMPGYGTVTALPLNGDDRVLVQGPGEPDASFVQRLKSFLRDWAYAGSHWAVLEEARFYMTPFLPFVEMVSNTGVYDGFASGAPNVNPDGTWIRPLHYPSPAGGFNWDAMTTQWWRVWQILFPGLSIVGAVTGATNTSPIVVTVTAHGLTSGDQVCLDNVHGNLAANGYWSILVIDADTFSLNGSTGSSAWASSSPQGICYFIPDDALQTGSQGKVAGPRPFVWGSPGFVWGASENANVSWGLNVAASWFDPLRVLMAEWKSANEWIVYFVFSFDTSLYSPWQDPTPTGNWDRWKNRNRNSRYVTGVL